MEKEIIINNMKNNKSLKFIFILIFALISATSLFSQESHEPKPYSDEEFSQVTLDLRRFEIITFGSMPFVTLDTILIYSTIKWGQNGFTGSFPNPFASSSESGYSNREVIGIICTVVSVSLLIGLTDYIYHVIKRNNTISNTVIQQDKIYVLPEELNPINPDINKESQVSSNEENE